MKVSTCALLDPRVTALSPILIGSMKGKEPEKKECGVFYNLKLMMSIIKLEFHYLKYRSHERVNAPEGVMLKPSRLAESRTCGANRRVLGPKKSLCTSAAAGSTGALHGPPAT